MSVIQFSRVSKKYLLGSGRPRSFQEVFVQRRLRGERQAFWALPTRRLALKQANGWRSLARTDRPEPILKLMSRVIDPTGGSIATHRPDRRAVGIRHRLSSRFNQQENIFLNGSILGISRLDIQRQLEAIRGCRHWSVHRSAGAQLLLGGMVVRLGFAVTTLLQPDILLIDEVLAVGDQNFQRKCMDRLAELQSAGVTLVFVSHSMEQVRLLCQRAIWLDHGVVRTDGDAEEVAGAYLDEQVSAQRPRLAPQFGVTSHQRWGSFQAEITQVEMFNRDGVCPPHFKTGDFFRLRMHYMAHTRIEERPLSAWPSIAATEFMSTARTA